MRKKPEWLKVRMPGGRRYGEVKGRAHHLGLHTVCEEAACPNVGECWGGGTATFMVMGDVCTRGCRFCNVKTRKHGAPIDVDEPDKLGRAIGEMNLDYAVITSVDRDDLPDQGAGHFAACIRAIHEHAPGTRVEVLIPDFQGDPALLQQVVDARPDVLAHNLECIERLTSSVRDPRASYQQSLDLLQRADGAIPSGGGTAALTKSSLMVGLGESVDELVAAMRDLREVGCDFLTIGQYLQPTRRHLEVAEYIEPAQFDRYQEIGLGLGFKYVASGPLVRSSYKAGELFIRHHLNQASA